MDKSGKNRRKAFTFAELMISLIIIAVLSAILYPTIAQFTPNANKPLFKSAYRTFNEVMTEIVNERPDGTLITANTNIDDDAALETPIQILCIKFCEKANVIMPLKADGTPETTCKDACANTQNGKPANLITTSNGMRWYFHDYETTYHRRTRKDGNPGTGSIMCYLNDDTPTITQADCVYGVFGIIVDVNASNNNLSLQGLSIFGNEYDDRYKFNTNCNFESAKGGCGTFIYPNTTAPTGIYTTLPNYSSGNNTPAQYNAQNLKNQDTFEIFIDRHGKIVDMSPAAWANLEDNTDTGN